MFSLESSCFFNHDVGHGCKKATLDGRVGVSLVPRPLPPAILIKARNTSGSSPVS